MFKFLLSVRVAELIKLPELPSTEFSGLFCTVLPDFFFNQKKARPTNSHESQSVFNEKHLKEGWLDTFMCIYYTDW